MRTGRPPKDNKRKLIAVRIDQTTYDIIKAKGINVGRLIDEVVRELV